MDDRHAGRDRFGAAAQRQREQIGTDRHQEVVAIEPAPDGSAKAGKVPAKSGCEVGNDAVLARSSA